MAPPASVPEFLDLVQKSGVADEAKLKAYLGKIGGVAALPAEPAKAAGQLVRDAMLTYFQAEQILQGKWKRFTIGKYRVLERLGAGGMGTVFLCEHKLMRRRVAVKVLPTAKAADQASLDRFNREARAAAAVDHPNIVRAFDIDQDENLHFLVMEYVDGTNLQDLVKKTGPLDPVRACHYVYASAVGLDHANAIGMVHRDIKPGNILLDRAGVVKILDMGLARLTFDTDDHITRKYDENILGTADYLSPEQAEDSHTVDIRSDIYSLGATFYFLLTGSQPFPEGTIPQKLIWHRTREPRPVREYRADVPDAVVAVLARMMAKKPEHRYQTPAEVMAALQPWVSIPIAPPTDAEMPQLSPALAASLGGRPAVRSTASPTMQLGAEAGSGIRLSSPASLSSAPTQIAVVTTAPTPSPGVWESLDDASPLAAGDTPPNGRAQPEARATRAPSGPSRRRTRPLLLAAGAAVVLIGGGIVAYFLRQPPEPPLPPVGSGAKRLIVSKSKSGEGTFQTLAQAVARAANGDTIAVEEPTLTESLVRVSRRDVTIESALPDGKPVALTLSAANPGTALVEVVNGAESFRLRGFVVDAQGGADYAIGMSGNIAGATLENVTVQGGKKGGVRLFNVAGNSAKPVVLDRVRVVVGPNQDAGVKVETQGNLSARALVVRFCRFEGPGRAGIRFEAPVDGVDVTNCRFFQLDSAISAARPADRQPLKLSVTQNMIAECKTGLVVTGKDRTTPNVVLTVSRNYFARVPEAIGRTDADLPGVTAKQNGRAPDANAGNLIPNAVVVNPAPEFSTNRADDPAFLRFLPGGAPTVEGLRVGAE
ncbi:serine/threonine protein kinase [Urbifossiella limnaea]|uniref:Serine/threonine-protein kinase PknB n=1 Tax=Urbifossiella limnaea TaxID=2528023 RepID=A0A517XTT3_9BACT|nr:serine/threonine-protein kinase [Urbifossiella limnaea]QDU20912.1 Serine/threonine-protein kinase PknB [Urbifossiella limnaea]